MLFEWDERKSRSNRSKHGVDFALAPSFDFANALIFIDETEIDEERFVAIGIIAQAIYVMVYVERRERIRVISLRRATRHEMKTYVQSLSSIDDA